MAILTALPETSLCLDTDVFTLLRNNNNQIRTKIRAYQLVNKTFPAISAITVFEANWGIQNELARNKISMEAAQSYQTNIDNFLDSMEILPFDRKAGELAAYIFGQLSQAEKNKHWQDVMIVATSISKGFGLATRNIKDAKLIAEKLPNHEFLKVADWR